MRLESPSFWQTKNPTALALSPLSALYYAGHVLKNSTRKPYESAIPVICVGGVVAGGSGKTPSVHALLKLVREQDLFERPVILTRGFGGALGGPTLVDPEFHSARDVGDEALLHSTHGPTILSRDRVAGARLAEAMGADVIILDDGLQNASLKKDLSFLVIDSGYGIGNGLMIPAGPLREPMRDAIAKCAAVIETSGKTGETYGIPVLSTATKIISEHDMSLSYHAFCGLGRPGKFFDMLDLNGFDVAGTTAFPDHHPYSPRDMASLKESSRGARLITTEKDFVRVPDSTKPDIEVVSIALDFDTPGQVVSLLRGLKSR